MSRTVIPRVAHRQNRRRSARKRWKKAARRTPPSGGTDIPPHAGSFELLLPLDQEQEPKEAASVVTRLVRAARRADENTEQVLLA
jgi:hypothetical protein